MRGFEAPRTDDHTADFLGSDGLEQGLAGLQVMRRPGRTPRDLPWTPDLSVRYSDWSAIAHDSSSAGSPGYDAFLETHRERVVDVARTIFEYLDHQVGNSGSQKRDAGRLDRAIEQYVRRTALSIYLQKLRDWKNEGKKGERPDKHQIEDELAGIFDEARENDPADPPPPPAGTQSHASDRCVEERRKCQEECACPCICTPTEGGGDDPLPTRDPSVRGLRMDLEVAGFFTPGPPRPGDVDGRMTVAEPDGPDYDLSHLGAGIYAQIPATSVRLRSLTRTVANVMTRLARTDHPRRIQHLLRRIAELEKRIADELQRLFERWMADFIRGLVGSAHLSEDVLAQLRRALRPMFLRQLQLDLERHALRSALRHTRDKKGEEYELLSIRIEDLEFETTLNEGDAWDTAADVLVLNDVHVDSVVQEHLEDLFLDAFETAVRQERREWPHRSKIEHEINDDWRLTVLASHPWTGWFGVRMESGRGPKRWDELEPSWGSTLRVTLLDFNQERYRYDRRRMETQIARAGFWKDVDDRIERDGEAVVFAETFLWTWATLAAFTLPFAAGGAAATAVGGGTLASTATGAGAAGATQFGLSSLRQMATQHDVDAGQAAEEALWAAGIQGFSAVLGKLVAGRATVSGRAGIIEGGRVSAGVSKAERVGKFFGIYPNAADPTRQAVLVERYMAQGFSSKAAKALARPYSGMGEHLIKREWLRAAGVPETALDTPLTLLRPRGISFGEMYELHFRVDRSFWGARMPGGLPSWRGKLVLGAEAKYGPLGKVWFGTPIGLKATGAAGGTGYAVYHATQSPPDATESSPDSEAPR